jgi:DNA-binding HxlR family transcriptional regulator
VTTQYAFTAYGRTLIPVLDAMGRWGAEHQRTTRRIGSFADL